MTPLFPKDYWKRFGYKDEDENDEDATKNGKANSKKSQSDSEKYKSLTESSTEKRVARDKRVANATHATHSANFPVDDSVDVRFFSVSLRFIVIVNPIVNC
jgi:hypothetical protein